MSYDEINFILRGKWENDCIDPKKKCKEKLNKMILS